MNSLSTRLDSYLVENGFVDSRNKAKELITQGFVEVDGNLCKKPARKVKDACIKLLQRVYISRAGRKLEGFLQSCGCSVEAKECLDIGASTGGFVQILLEKGAKSVTAVDVGTNQLAKSLQQDSRVIDVSPCDIRDFVSDSGYDLVTCDLSFISLQSVLDSIVRLAKDEVIILFKPQFEVGRQCKRNAKGVIQDSSAVQEAIERFEAAVAPHMKIKSKQQSTLKGKEGNVEYIYWLAKY